LLPGISIIVVISIKSRLIDFHLIILSSDILDFRDQSPVSRLCQAGNGSAFIFFKSSILIKYILRTDQGYNKLNSVDSFVRAKHYDPQRIYTRDACRVTRQTSQRKMLGCQKVIKIWGLLLLIAFQAYFVFMHLSNKSKIVSTNNIISPVNSILLLFINM
jgi:hypothetical protein